MDRSIFAEISAKKIKLVNGKRKRKTQLQRDYEACEEIINKITSQNYHHM